MAHTLAADKNPSTRDNEDITISVIDPDQEEEMARVREKLMRSRMKPNREFSPAIIGIRKRYRVR